MRKILSNNNANVAMIGTAVALLVTIMVSILVVYSILGTVDTDDVDENFGDWGAGRYAEGGSLEKVNGSTPSLNATNAVTDQAATFYTLAPLIVVVLVAVVILGYVTTIGRVE